MEFALLLGGISDSGRVALIGCPSAPSGRTNWIHLLRLSRHTARRFNSVRVAWYALPSRRDPCTALTNSACGARFRLAFGSGLILLLAQYLAFPTHSRFGTRVTITILALGESLGIGFPNRSSTALRKRRATNQGLMRCRSFCCSTPYLFIRICRWP